MDAIQITFFKTNLKISNYVQYRTPYLESLGTKAFRIFWILDLYVEKF
jgi:hypothetical protein